MTDTARPSGEGPGYPRRHALPVDAAEVDQLRARLAATETALAQSREAARIATVERDALLSSVSWRAMAPVRRITGAFRHGPAPDEPPAPLSPPSLPPGTDYDAWLRDYHMLTDADRTAITAHIGRLSVHPLISIVVPIGDEAKPLTEATLTSIKTQLYPHWDICFAVADPGEDDAGAALIAALARARGEFVTLVTPGDRLAPEALYEVVVALNHHPETDLVYTDEDCMDEAGHRFAPAFKPDWNIDLLLAQNMVGRLSVYRRSVLQAAMQPAGPTEHGLALMVAKASTAGRMRHVPAVLYHRLTPAAAARPLFDADQPPAWTAPNVAAVEAYLGDEADIVTWPGEPARLQINWRVPDPWPRVSLIVPTRDNAALLARCAAGLLHRTDYPDIELLIVDNGSRDPVTLGLLARLQQDRRVTVLHDAGAFNYAAINNRAVVVASGEIIVLINDDIDVIDEDWLRQMVRLALRPDIGAVGAKLLYGDGRIQHAGVILGVGEHSGRGGIAGHFGHGAPGDVPGYLDQYALTREVSGVTAACMALRREVFDAVGGFDAANLPIAYNDVDLCLRIRARGWRIVWTPFAELFHLESQSRGRDVTPEQRARAAREAGYMRDRWDRELSQDPFYNPNFDWLFPMQRLADPPRRMKPWRNERKE